MADAPALPSIPTGKIEEALPHLRRPFTAGAVKWKVQASGPKGTPTWAIVIGYIDARLVAERLNAVVAGGWTEAEPQPVEGHPNLLRYKLTVLGQAHTDVGEGQGQDSKPGMIVKARDSDAFKRAAVKFGIGSYLYAMPPFNFYVTPSEEMKDDKPTLLRLKSGKVGYLKEQHERWAREEYQRWLQSDEGKQFGEPLDHGDAHTGSVGGLAEGLNLPDEAEASDEDLAPPALEDDQAKQLHDVIARTYRELCAVNPNRLAKGRLDRMVAEAAHSHGSLEQVGGTIANLLSTEKQLSGLREELTEKVGAKAAKPLIDSAERRGSQEERIAAMEKALSLPTDG